MKTVNEKPAKNNNNTEKIDNLANNNSNKSNNRNNSKKQDKSLKFDIDSKNVGRVIGKQGNFIKRLRNNFNINIEIPNDKSHENYTPILLEGPIKEVQDCKEMILKRLNIYSNSNTTYPKQNNTNSNRTNDNFNNNYFLGTSGNPVDLR